MIWSRLSNTAPIALDLGMSSLRAIQLERKGTGYSIRHWINQTLSVSDADAGNEMLMLPGLENARLTNLKPFAGRQVVASITPPDVEVCSLRVPEKLMSRGIDNAIAKVRHEVDRQISASANSAEMGAWRLPPGQPDGPNLMVAATPKALIKRLLDWVDSQGCVCTRIDVSPLATMRACARMVSDPSPDHLWAVMDIGLRATRFYLGIGETPVYVRGLPASGDLMTRRIANELGIDLKMAERYKRHFGIRAETSGYRPVLAQQGPIDSKRMASILLGTLKPVVRGMAQDIEKSFRYAMDLYPGLPVSELVLVGGGSSLDGLPELLAEMLGIPVQRASADSLDMAGTNHPALAEKTVVEMATCLGMSYGEVR